jgi:hypothetical protein
VISMVVIGGLGSIDGAVLGALYLVGLPAIFGTTATIQFITSGIGLLAFILYLPCGLAELLRRFGDLVSFGWDRLVEGPGGTGPGDTDGGGEPPPPRRPGQPDDEPDDLEEALATAGASGPGAAGPGAAANMGRAP